MAASSSIGSPSPGTGGGFSISRISAGKRGFCRAGGTGTGVGPPPVLSPLISLLILSTLLQNSSGGTVGPPPILSLLISLLILSNLRSNSSGGRSNISWGSVGLVTKLSTGPAPGRGG